jgi:outer membrane protein assembly factor BamB
MENSMQSASQKQTNPGAKPATLRWWPAVLLLAGMLFLRMLSGMFEAPGLPIFMASFMGPAALGAVVMLWWLFASRASVSEKLIGATGVVVFGVVGAIIIHKSMQGMSVMLYQIPYGTAWFAIPLILFASKPSIRLPIALGCSLVGFGVWDLLQTEGVNGKFAASYLWRWQPNAEDRYMASLTNKPAPSIDMNSSQMSSETITLASSSWPSFRGPNRDSKLPGVKLDEDWANHPPKKLWSTKIGPAWSSFTVAGERLFTQEQRGDREAVLCMNATSGETIWTYEYEDRFWEPVAGAGPRATPTIADEGLFALGGNGVLVCLNPINGSKIWQRDIKEDAGRKPPTWGYSASPLVTGGLVIVHAGGADSKGLLAFDAKSGNPAWSAPSGDHSYSSAHLATFHGVTGVLMVTNQGIQFVDSTTGGTIWEHDVKCQNYRTLQPLMLGNSIVLATSLGEGTRLLDVVKQGEAWSIQEKWVSRDMKADFNDFVEHQGFLYGFDGNIFACVDLENGKRKWKKGRYGNGQVLVLSDANQLLVISETGDLVLLHADASQMVEVAKFKAIEGKTWNHPVLIGNKLYVRNAEEAACFELSLGSTEVL